MKVRRVWTCKCDETSAFRSADEEDRRVIVRGSGFMYGSPPTHIACSACLDTYRVCPEIVWADTLALKKKKRQAARSRRKEKNR